VRHPVGTLYKPDLVCDIQISWEVGSSSTQVLHIRQSQVPGGRRSEMAWGGVRVPAPDSWGQGRVARL
jgi:hypothetical protein